MRRNPRTFVAYTPSPYVVRPAPKWNPDLLIQALQPVLEGKKQADVFPSVTKELLTEIVRLSHTGMKELENFNRLRLDLNPQRLTVQYPNRWDFIPRIIFGRLIRQGAFNPPKTHNGRSLLDRGCTERPQHVHLSDGVKSPVYAIHEKIVREGNLVSLPSLLVEVGSSHDAGRLDNDAARYISESNRGVRMVVTLELGFALSQGEMTLQKATWSHWEAEECLTEKQLETSLQQMSLTQGAQDSARFASRTATYQVWPVADTEAPGACIDILVRHLFSEYEDGNTVALQIPLQLVREVLLQYTEAKQERWAYQPEEERYPNM